MCHAQGTARLCSTQVGGKIHLLYIDYCEVLARSFTSQVFTIPGRKLGDEAFSLSISLSLSLLAATAAAAKADGAKDCSEAVSVLISTRTETRPCCRRRRRRTRRRTRRPARRGKSVGVGLGISSCLLSQRWVPLVRVTLEYSARLQDVAILKHRRKSYISVMRI